MTEALRAQLRQKQNITPVAMRRLDMLLDDGTTFAFVSVCRMFAEHNLCALARSVSSRAC